VMGPVSSFVHYDERSWVSIHLQLETSFSRKCHNMLTLEMIARCEVAKRRCGDGLTLLMENRGIYSSGSVDILWTHTKAI
jgi:hypothetical protein